MEVQIEVTTRCNFDCFYCAGRDMVQQDMPWETFEALLTGHIARYGVPSEVQLQGEGEPTLNKHFFDMAARVKELGSTPFAITNGTYKDPERFFEYFDSVGVSLDTLDEQKATEVGRYNLPRVLDYIETLSKRLKVRIYTVAVGDDLDAVKTYCADRGLHHTIQPLQTKPDYAYRYANQPTTPTRDGPFWCEYTVCHRMRFYNIQGQELPCCYIKDASQYPGIAEFIAQAKAGRAPSQCDGCERGMQPPLLRPFYRLKGLLQGA